MATKFKILPKVTFEAEMSKEAKNKRLYLNQTTKILLTPGCGFIKKFSGSR